MNFQFLRPIAAAISIFSAGAVCCQTQSFGQADIPSTQGRSALPVRSGVVIDIQDVAIEVPASQESRVFGGILGGLVGAAAANGQPWQVQGAAGTGGAFVGTQIAQHLSEERRDASQVVVQMTDGQAIAVVQEMNGTPLSVGDAVFVVGAQPAIRVVKAPAKVSVR